MIESVEKWVYEILKVMTLSMCIYLLLSLDQGHKALYICIQGFKPILSLKRAITFDVLPWYIWSEGYYWFLTQVLIQRLENGHT